VTLPLLAVCAIVGVLSYASAALMRRYATTLGFVDVPNVRSLHAQPTPRAGGLGFAILVPLATVVAVRLWTGSVSAALVTFVAAAMVLALVSLADDRWGLSIGVRFASQIAAAVAVIAAGGLLREISLSERLIVPLGPAALPATLAWLVFATNIYNFMDGTDGLAAGQGIVTAVTMGILAATANATVVMLAMGILAAGVLGFLALNWPPARIFMGDVGSTFLGFTFAGWAVLTGGTRDGPLPFIAWIAVLSPFLFDAALTLVRRILRGERLHEAHRQHLYQRLVGNGWSHAAVAVLYMTLASAAGGLTLFHYLAYELPLLLFAALLASVLAIPVLLTHHSARA
jgi:UDP-N-acetylmuramyl pentapeptide phosphotransferase/UDP-N-acetylglucosamine-1-phosphate transferase